MTRAGTVGMAGTGRRGRAGEEQATAGGPGDCRLPPPLYRTAACHTCAMDSAGPLQAATCHLPPVADYPPPQFTYLGTCTPLALPGGFTTASAAPMPFSCLPCAQAATHLHATSLPPACPCHPAPACLTTWVSSTWCLNIWATDLYNCVQFCASLGSATPHSPCGHSLPHQSAILFLPQGGRAGRRACPPALPPNMDISPPASHLPATLRSAPVDSPWGAAFLPTLR